MTTEAFTTLSYKHPIIIFDGICHLCDVSVQFILKRDSKAAFRYCTLQYVTVLKLMDIKTDSVVLYHKGKIFLKSDAGIQILKILGGKYSVLSVILSVFPAFLRNVFYDWIAKNRYKWFGKYNECMIPQKGWKDRFIG